MITATLTPVYIGKYGETGIYRIDLSQSGLTSISNITFKDDSVTSGGTGAASGFDLDFVKVSSTLTAGADSVAAITGDPVFDYTADGVLFSPGARQAYHAGDPASWNAPYLFGTTADVYNQGAATLGVLDGTRSSDDGSISLGEGGQLTLYLSQALSSGAKYLYFGDSGGGNDKVQVTVSGPQACDGPTTDPQPVSPPATDPVTPTNPITIPATDLIDTFYTGTRGNDRMVMGEGKYQDSFVENVGLDGLEGNDFMYGGSGHDAIFGGKGNDLVHGLGGNDRLSGGIGNDRLYGDDGNDFIEGGAQKDLIYGGAGNDVLYGGTEKDTISGGVGNDVIYGAKGNDRLTGGVGEDVFVFHTTLDGKTNVDRITDFNAHDDSIWLRTSEFKALGNKPGAPTHIKADAFWKGSAAHDANDHIIYNSTTGALYYDSDGTGAAQQVQFAQLAKNLNLTSKDFLFF